MQQYVKEEIDNGQLVFTEDLKNVAYLMSKANDDIELFLTMIRKYVLYLVSCHL